MEHIIGVDVGGTFTDVVAFSGESEGLRVAKVASTPSNPAAAVLQGIERIMSEHELLPEDITFLIHGTTVATNAMLERKGALVGLLVTEGFRDVLAIGRQDRPKLYDLREQRPKPFVPRHRRYEISERMLYTGEVFKRLDVEGLRRIARELRQQEVTSIAVCFLHSYANSTHELQAREIIKEEYPEASVSLSCEVLPEIKEYERMNTTVINSYVMPIVDRYLSYLADALEDRGIRSRLHIMQSNGGIMTAETARQQSVYTLLSGLAAGVLAGVALGVDAGYENVITMDMGGTSFDVALAYEGECRLARESRLGGFDVKIPMLDINTLGAGGGSIAWIDRGGALRVGPQSAGADPGPVSYGRGGKEPTVTDANLVLGRLNPDYFLGGEISLDVEAARGAIQDRIAEPLGLSLERAAEGIIEVVNANMLRGIRVISVERGYDPREFAMVAFGGAGPVHAADLARELGAQRVVVPGVPGVTSAFGLLVADFRHDYFQTYLTRCAELDFDELNARFVDLERQANDQLLGEHVSPQNILLTRTAEMRYVGQGYSLDLPVPHGVLDVAALGRVQASFHALHEKVYGYSMLDQPIELASLHLIGIGQLPKPKQQRQEPVSIDPSGAQKGSRPVWFGGAYLETPVYERAKLQVGNRLSGPAVVEQLDSTVVIPPDRQAEVDGYGNIIISVQ